MALAAPIGTILVGEDDREVRHYIEVALRCHKYDVVSASDGEEVMACLRSGPQISAVLLDLMMPRKDGFETLRDIRQMRPDIPVIMLSAMSSPTNVVNAMKIGATDFLPKPVSHEDVGKALSKALLPSWPQHDSNPEPVIRPTQEMFFGNNAKVRSLRPIATAFAQSDFPILVQGETGTGKEVLARQIHSLSPRMGKPFVKINCAAFPPDLMESEVFGYERGAFTGAFQKKLGIFEIANGGTILLDEIGDMDMRLQAKLLQFLQDHEFRRLGGKEMIRVDVRLIAATHRDLEGGIRNNTFREDLYYRLNALTLVLPALRDRKDDIIGMTEFLLRKHSTASRPAAQLTPALKEQLLAYNWPGNIRELENVVRRFSVLREPDLIISDLRDRAKRYEQAQSGAAAAECKPQTVPADVPASSVSSSILEQVSRAKEQAEAEAILNVLKATRWNRKQAAVLLNIDYKALLYKIKKLSIEQRVGASTS